MIVAMSVLCLASSVVLMFLVLLHKGAGGGLSDLLGGGGGAVAGSASASKNLSRFTWVTAAVWATSVLALAILNA